MAKFCTTCGTHHEGPAKFCKNCGAKFPEIGQPTEPVLQPPAQQFVPPAGQPVYQPVQPFQPVQQAGPASFIEKQKVLYDAPYRLNRPEQPWSVAVEGDAIVARWKWMDATFFAPHEVTNETRDYTFTVTLTDKGTWRELDHTQNNAAGVKVNNGKISFGGSSNTFIGKQNKKSFQLGVGQNNQTGNAGLVGFKFNTTAVKEPIRGYLTACGWKKAGLFG